MEAQSLGSIPWPTIDASLADLPIRVIVPIIVVEELDDLLHDRDADRKKKAREARRFMRSVHPGNKPPEPAPLPDNPNVTLEVLVDSDWRNRRSNNDAEIIDQALQVHRMTGRSAVGL
jgi:predicted ribonuclease YlaK